MNDTLRRLLEITTVMEILHQAEDMGDVQTGAIVAESSGRIIHASDGACSIFGYSVEEIRGLSIGDLMPERYRRLHDAAFGRVAAGAESRLAGKRLSLIGKTKDGAEIGLALKLEIRDTSELGRLYVGRIWSMKDIDRSLMLEIETAARKVGDAS